MPAHVSCKELIEMFHKIGGTIVCTYDTRECTLLPQNISCKIMPKHKTVIGSLLTDFVYSGSYQQCVTTFPESEQSKKRPFIQEPIHDYQEKGVGGFAIELVVDDDGRWNAPNPRSTKPCGG